MNDAVRAAREHNSRALIHRKLSHENFCSIFLALALLDVPALSHPQGWLLQISGVCHHWRQIAVDYAELWAVSAGSFPSNKMTDLAIQRAGGSTLCFDGHSEDHNGSDHVLTEYQRSLIQNP